MHRSQVPQASSCFGPWSVAAWLPGLELGCAAFVVCCALRRVRLIKCSMMQRPEVTLLARQRAAFRNKQLLVQASYAPRIATVSVHVQFSDVLVCAVEVGLIRCCMMQRPQTSVRSRHCLTPCDRQLLVQVSKL